MTGFEYQRPRTLAEASELLARDDSVALAGGTDLLVAMRHRKSEPSMVVDLKSVTELGSGVVVQDDQIRIGGRVTMRQLIDDEVVNEHFPALVEAASVVGSVQIRNRATLAGNICNASPAADTAPALLAYDTSVAVDGPKGSRVVRLQDFFVGPGVNALGRGELVTSVDLPIPSALSGSVFGRVTRRRGVDLASVNLACVVDDAGGVRFGFGAVGPTPLLEVATRDMLTTDAGWESLLVSTRPISDVRASADYRRAMLEVHSRRALAAAIGRLEDRG